MRRPRHWRRWLLLAALPILIYIVLVRLLQPERLGALVLEQAGLETGLRIDSTQPARLGLWHGLSLDIDGLLVDTREGRRLLQAERLSLRLPLSVLWSDIRIDAADLQAPLLDLDALLAWQQANRESGPPRPLTIPAAAALSVRDGRILSNAVDIEALNLDMHGLAAGAQLQLEIGAELHTAHGLHLPFHLLISGPVRALGESLRIEPLSLALGDSDAQAFAQFAGSLDWLPPLRLDVVLDGHLGEWPAAWPELPTPVLQRLPGSSLGLQHAGPGDASGDLELHWRSGTDLLDLDLRWPSLLAWIDAGDWLRPVPVRMQLDVPVLEVEGIRIEGLHIDQDGATDAE